MHTQLGNFLYFCGAGENCSLPRRRRCWRALSRLSANCGTLSAPPTERHLMRAYTYKIISMCSHNNMCASALIWFNLRTFTCGANYTPRRRGSVKRYIIHVQNAEMRCARAAGFALIARSESCFISLGTSSKQNTGGEVNIFSLAARSLAAANQFKHAGASLYYSRKIELF